MLVEVAVGAPVRGSFTYRTEDPEALAPGRRLLVPFGPRRAIGISLGAAKEAPDGEVRWVEAVLDEGPVFSEDLLSLIRFASDYYLYPLGEALRSALPPDLGRIQKKEVVERAPAPDRAELLVPEGDAAAGLGRSPKQAALVAYLGAQGGVASMEELRRAVPGAPALLRRLEEKGLVRLGYPDPLGDSLFHGQAPPRLTGSQATALEEIASATGRYETFLLRGVTGSGKTEIYLRAIQRIREADGGALVLVPEIALTPQLAGRFRSRFGEEVAVLHSGMTDRERTKEHKRLLDGEARIAVGARSVVFAPMRNLGMIVVDEEHDGSFKQEEKLRYHARDLAVVRARLLGIPCVLGSATPSLESLENTRRGKYRLLELPQRVDDRPLPPVEIVDRSGLAGANEGGGEVPDILGARLSAALEETLAAGRQAILFLNRRGHASLVLCPTCGESASCTNCDVGLTHHLSREELRCHYCDLRVPRWNLCPTCNTELLVLGVGTERVEQELLRRFPSAKVARLDRDSASTGARITNILSSFAKKEADVLVGTQMIAKGHDFPGVTLVGVVLADIGLGLPDFRAGERTFQLLTQVAGRAGRGEEPGRVIIQTFHPKADPIACAQTHDYLGFSEGELRRRKELGYPPFRRMMAVRVEAQDTARAERLIGSLGELARRHAVKGMQILGPAPAPMARLRGRSRFQLLILAEKPADLLALGRRLQDATAGTPYTVKVSFDMDPVSMM